MLNQPPDHHQTSQRPVRANHVELDVAGGEVRVLGGAVARDDFAGLRLTPPLLYHNDLTASVSRYYWSEDFGYLLWLRLYEKVRAAAERSEMPTR